MRHGPMATPKSEADEQAFSRYVSEATARIRASWPEITHRVRTSGLTVEAVRGEMEWRARWSRLITLKHEVN